MSEKNLRHAVRDALKPAFVLQVENGVVMGTPDTYACFEGRGFWVELKFAEVIPARASTSLFKSLNRGLTVEQEAVLFKMWQYAPRSAWVLLRIGKAHYLVPGYLSYNIVDFTLAEFAPYELKLSDLRSTLLT